MVDSMSGMKTDVSVAFKGFVKGWTPTKFDNLGTAIKELEEKQLGKEFWNRVYRKVQEQHGNVQIPVNTFNKVWIMADKAEVFEQGQTAFVVTCHLKVMLEEDYLAMTRNTVGVGLAPAQNIRAGLPLQKKLSVQLFFLH